MLAPIAMLCYDTLSIILQKPPNLYDITAVPGQKEPNTGMFSEGTLAYQGFGVSEKRTEREIDSPLRFEKLPNNISVTYHLCFFYLKKTCYKKEVFKIKRNYRQISI